MENPEKMTIGKNKCYDKPTLKSGKCGVGMDKVLNLVVNEENKELSLKDWLDLLWDHCDQNGILKYAGKVFTHWDGEMMVAQMNWTHEDVEKTYDDFCAVYAEVRKTGEWNVPSVRDVLNKYFIFSQSEVYMNSRHLCEMIQQGEKEEEIAEQARLLLLSMAIERHVKNLMLK